MGLNLHRLFMDVFHPESDETVVVIADVPQGDLEDKDFPLLTCQVASLKLISSGGGEQEIIRDGAYSV